MKKKYLKAHWPNVKHVCERDKYPYDIIDEDDTSITVDITVAEELMDELEEDALCEKQRQETGSKLPVYSYRTLVNKEKRDRLMAFYGKRGHFVYKSDYEKVRRHCV